jgi:DNA-binding transcriptional regulator YhcF (GntR family)
MFNKQNYFSCMINFFCIFAPMLQTGKAVVSGNFFKAFKSLPNRNLKDCLTNPRGFFVCGIILKMMYKRRRLQFNEGLIADAVANGYLTSLSFFAKAKLLFHNNTIYNYSTRRLAELMKVSHTNVAENIRVLKKHGLVRITGSNLIFVKTTQNHKCSVVVNNTDSINVIKTKLCSKILEMNVRQQEQKYNLKRKVRLLNTANFKTTVKEVKKIYRYLKSASPHETFWNDIPSLSLNKISELLSTSVKTAQHIKSRLKETKTAFFENRSERIGNIPYHQFKINKDSLKAHFWYKGSAYRVLPCAVSFTPYWKKEYLAK